MIANRKTFAALCIAGLSLLSVSCCSADNRALAASPARGQVSDVAAFDRFVATQPTADQFRARYPDVLLVLPGEVATKELRADRSRYFADLDREGRIVGGRFK